MLKIVEHIWIFANNLDFCFLPKTAIFLTSFKLAYFEQYGITYSEILNVTNHTRIREEGTIES
jgi:hypothetical protein